MNDSWQDKLKLEEYVQNAYDTTLSETPLFRWTSRISKLKDGIFYLNMTWFMTTLLDRKDRMSMGASLEVRVPFADHRLVEYAWNIPWEYKMVAIRKKVFYERHLKAVCHMRFLYRKKSPYPKTHNPVYTAIVSNLLKEQLRNKNSILHELFQKQRLTDFIESNGEAFKVPWFGQLMSGPQLLAYLVQMDIWFKECNVQLVD